MIHYEESVTAFSSPLVAQTTTDALTSASDLRADQKSLSVFQARLESHSICFVVPAGAMFDGTNIRLQGGILVLGALRGKVTCATGSAIIAKGGEFQGYLEANDVLVEGRITSPLDSAGRPVKASITDVRARGQKNAITGEVLGGILMLSSQAAVCARLRARAYQIPRNANVSGSIMETLSDF